MRKYGMDTLILSCHLIGEFLRKINVMAYLYDVMLIVRAKICQQHLKKMKLHLAKEANPRVSL